MAWLDPKDAAPDEWAGSGSGGEHHDVDVSARKEQTFTDLQGDRPPSVPPSNPPTVEASFGDFDPTERVPIEGPENVAKANYEVDGVEYATVLKCYPQALVEDRSGFDRAVSMWSQLDDHHAIAGVVDWGTRRRPWIATEPIDSRLSERDTPFRIDRGLWVISRVASALDHAHGNGIVHGDVSPRTVVFEEVWEEAAWDYPKVTDLGLWRQLYRDRDDRVGVVPGYAAPEQIQPERFGDVDATTDIYQLGVVAFETLTGRPPFEGSPREQLSKTVRSDPPLVDEVNPTVPDELSTVVAKCLRREKIARYETVRAVRRDLSRLD